MAKIGRHPFKLFCFSFSSSSFLKHFPILNMFHVFNTGDTNGKARNIKLQLQCNGSEMLSNVSQTYWYSFQIFLTLYC